MSLTTKYTLKPALQATFKGIIWKVATDAGNRTIAIETRNAQDRTASFSAFNFESGVTLFRDLTVPDSWNWGLDLASHGHVFLHSYVNEKTPEHKAIMALDRTGRIAWEIYNKALDSVSPAGLIVYNPSLQPKTFELLEPETGQTIERTVSDIKKVDRDAYFPEMLADPSAFTDIWSKEMVVGPVFRLAHNNKECFSFHTGSGCNFSQYLLISSMGVILHEEILESNIQKLNPEPFYIEQDHLFCIRNNKSEIVAYLV